MPITKSAKNLFTLSISCMTALTLAGCSGGGGGGGLASTATASRTVSVTGRTANITLASEANGSVSSPRVGLVAYASGIDRDRGQIVGVAGIADGATVGAPVTGGTVTYDNQYNYQVTDDITRAGGFIRGRRASPFRANRTTLTANFDNGSLTGSARDLSVNGRINGQAVTGSATVNYSLIGGGPPTSGSVRTDLNGQIGNNGVIATFHGVDSNTVVTGGLVGTAN